MEQELVGAADRAPVLRQDGRFEGRASGIGGRQESFIVLESGADGLIVRTREYETLEEALRAAELPG